jgi:hypothetical protein
MSNARERKSILVTPRVSGGRRKSSSSTNRVVHSSHFSLIFAFIFDLIFHLKFKNVLENKAEDDTFLQNGPPPPHFAKSFIFHPLFRSHFPS